MPIYEYKCPDCGETFEALQSINDEPLDECKVKLENGRALVG